MSPTACKRPRTSCTSGKVVYPIADGNIRLDVPKLAELKTSAKSPVVSIANLPWSLEVRSECSMNTSNINHLSVYVNCNEGNKSPYWGCEASVTFSLLSQRVGQKSYTQEAFVRTFCNDYDGWGCSLFVPWDTVVDRKNGFIRKDDGGVVVEAAIAVIKVIGLPESTLCDFTAPQPNLTDVVLIVEEKPLHVSKTYLAFHSPVFHSMFFSDIEEKSKEEIPLEDGKYDEFVELLHVISPSRKPITEATVEFLLRLGDQFGIKTVINECEQFLCGGCKVPFEKTLLWAECYSLASLKYICLNKIQSVDEVRTFKGKKEYGEFSSTMKEALLERILELG